MGLPFERLGDLPKGSKAWAPLGPMYPRDVVVIGAWFLAREVELSCARTALVTVKDGARPSVTHCLPATGDDLSALGVARSHFCICRAGPRNDCLACGARGSSRKSSPAMEEGLILLLATPSLLPGVSSTSKPRGFTRELKAG